MIHTTNGRLVLLEPRHSTIQEDMHTRRYDLNKQRHTRISMIQDKLFANHII